MEGCPGLSAIQSQNHCAGALGRAMEGGREGEREREIWAQAILAQAIWAQVWLKLELPGLGEGHWVFFARYSGPEVHGQPFLLNFVLGGHTIARYRDLIPGGPCVCGG